MAKQRCSEEEFIVLCGLHSTAEIAKLLKVTMRSVQQRKQDLEARRGQKIEAPVEKKPKENENYSARHELSLHDGTILVGSDAHYWPGIISTAHKGFVRMCKDLKPEIVILNGDVFDGARISRHPPLGWKRQPTVKEELEAVEDRTAEIVDVTKNSLHLWSIGNHCARFENKLASDASDFAEVNGFSLRDHFPAWHMAMSFWLNDDLVIKHRFKGGVHATHNNTMAAGKSMITGHLHSLKVTPYSDYNGIRYGIDTGTLADPYGDQFTYSEDNPLNHRSGFIVLTIKDGMLLWPEIVAVVEKDLIQFRGQLIDV